MASLLKSELNATNLSSNQRVVLGKTAELGQTGASLLSTTHTAEPARRFGNKEDSADEDHRDEDGDDQGNAPLDGKEVDLEEAQVDPGLKNVTQADEAAVQNCVRATVLRSRAL